jgi:hypothetical protein
MNRLSPKILRDYKAVKTPRPDLAGQKTLIARQVLPGRGAPCR